MLTAELRRYLPNVQVFMNGHDRVIWRYNDQQVACPNERGAYRIQTHARFGGMYYSERHDEFTARNFAKTLAGHFDATFSGGDR